MIHDGVTSCAQIKSGGAAQVGEIIHNLNTLTYHQLHKEHMIKHRTPFLVCQLAVTKTGTLPCE